MRSTAGRVTTAGGSGRRARASCQGYSWFLPSKLGLLRTWRVLLGREEHFPMEWWESPTGPPSPFVDGKSNYLQKSHMVVASHMVPLASGKLELSPLIGRGYTG